MLSVKQIEMTIGGDFWTDIHEMADDLEDLGYRVEDYNDEYAVIMDPEEEDEQEFILYLGHANKTMWVEKIREC